MLQSTLRHYEGADTLQDDGLDAQVYTMAVQDTVSSLTVILCGILCNSGVLRSSDILLSRDIHLSLDILRSNDTK